MLQRVEADEKSIPLKLADSTAKYRTMLHHSACFIILDNAKDAAQVRPLLPGSASCFVLVTSRDDLAGLVARDGAQRVEMDLLAPARRHRKTVILATLTVPGPDGASRRGHGYFRHPALAGNADGPGVSGTAPVPTAAPRAAAGGQVIGPGNHLALRRDQRANPEHQRVGHPAVGTSPRQARL